jgi:hypothetical protein
MHDTAPREPDLSILGLLREVVNSSDGERITIGDILHGMKDRAAGALILIFALPNVLPTPPGTSTALGFPLLLICAQLATGFPVWLPRLITRRSVKRAGIEQMLVKAEPWLKRTERLLRPRMKFLSNPLAQRLLGVFALWLSIILVLPIPLGNVPPATALCLIALGLLAADGIFIAAGILAGFVSLFIVWGVVYALASGVGLALKELFAADGRPPTAVIMLPLCRPTL